MREIVLGQQPNPKQAEFFRATQRHIAYGGARGGGKSWAMRTKFVMLAGRYDNLKILLLRRTMPELMENHIKPLRSLLYGVATYSEQRHEFTFPNGSIIKCGYCEHERDVDQYQGQEYDVIGFEEATMFTEYQKDMISACNRTVRDDFKPRIYYTCNPGGVGHNWVKRLFVDREYKPNENPDDYYFIQASVFDNKVLMKNNPEYIQTLEALPEHLRKAHLYGDWDVLAGQYFSNFSRATHVIKPFEIPDWWKRFRAIDYGLDCAACVWGAFDDKNNCVIYREYAEPNKVISDFAREILARTYENITVTYAPFDMWGRSRESGQTQAEIFAKHGVMMTRVKQSREAGWLNLAEWMKIVDGEPHLKIFETCTGLIKNIPLLTHDDKKPTDVSTEPHEITHLPDALRYLMGGRPFGGQKPEEEDEEEKPIKDEEEIQNFLNYGT